MDQTTKLKPLTPEALYRRSNSQNFSFNTTADLDGLTEFVGHLRALQAVQFGIGIRRRGFNLFLLGPVGMGKYAIARSLLEKRAATEATPDEWCYVNHFDNPETPRALSFRPAAVCFCVKIWTTCLTICARRFPRHLRVRITGRAGKSSNRRSRRDRTRLSGDSAGG